MRLHIFKKISKTITSSIKIKINLLITTMVLVSLLIITIIFSSIYSRMMIKQTTESSIHKLQLISNNISLLTSSIENYARMIITSQQMQDILMDDASNTNHLQHLNNINNLKGTFSNLVARDNIINSILILNLNDSFIYDIGGNASGINKDNFVNSHITNRLLQKKEHYIWTDVYASSFKVSSRHTDIFTLYESIMNMNTGHINGIITVNINESAISSILSQTYLGKTGQFFMVSPTGVIMSSGNPELLYTTIANELYYSWCLDNQVGGSIFKSKGYEHLVVTYEIENGWRLIGSVPLQEILPPGRQINTYIFIISILVFIIASIASLYFAKRIITPILHITHLMRNTNTYEDLDLRVDESSYKDESGLLLRSYNNMMAKITTLIEQVKEEQHLKRKYEVSLINSQIKPHFLYNSLNTICGLICLNDNKKALHMTQSLGQFYKLSLNHGNSLITIQEATQLIESYVNLQRHSYGDRLTYFTDFDPNLLHMVIPKLLLQPLVENAFKHGFRGMDDRDPILCISGKRHGHFIELCVSDNGKGNDPQYIQNLIHEKEDAFVHFGLRSIGTMLSLHYQDHYSLTCDTEIEKGMRIILCLPIGEEGYHDKGLIS